MANLIHTLDDTCPCQSKHAFSNCCGPYLNQLKPAPTPEALMRSRYTAFVLNDMTYIQQTMCNPAAKRFDPKSTRNPNAHLWLGLTVIETHQKNEHQGVVTFIARYKVADKKHCIYEISEFIKDNNCWYYSDGTHPKVSRNQSCPCLSGIKAKRCCFSP